jgi:hypothetical protein
MISNILAIAINKLPNMNMKPPHSALSAKSFLHVMLNLIQHLSKPPHYKTLSIVIPACLESFLKKDAGQASMTKQL